MAVNQGRKEISLIAAGDLSALQFTAIYVNAGSADTAAAGATKVIGVLTNKPSAAGQTARVCIGGVTKMKAGAAITAGSSIVAVAGGMAEMLAAGAGTSYIGVAITGAAASADLFDVLVAPWTS